MKLDFEFFYFLMTALFTPFEVKFVIEQRFGTFFFCSLAMMGRLFAQR